MCIAVGVAVWMLPKQPTSSNVNSEDLEIKKAVAKVQSGENPMEGIAALLEIERKSPDNEEINFHLGVFSSISGQYEKAIPRLEKICGKPNYQEACYHLAQSYLQTGDTLQFKTLVSLMDQRYGKEEWYDRVTNLLLNP